MAEEIGWGRRNAPWEVEYIRHQCAHGQLTGSYSQRVKSYTSPWAIADGQEMLTRQYPIYQAKRQEHNRKPEHRNPISFQDEDENPISLCSTFLVGLGRSSLIILSDPPLPTHTKNIPEGKRASIL